jgi:hypothetical protein
VLLQCNITMSQRDIWPAESEELETKLQGSIAYKREGAERYLTCLPKGMGHVLLQEIA